LKTDTLKRFARGIDKKYIALSKVHLNGNCAEVTDSKVLFIEQISEDELPDVCVDPLKYQQSITPLTYQEKQLKDTKGTLIVSENLKYPNTAEVIEENNKLTTKFKVGMSKTTLRKLLDVLCNDEEPIILEFKEADKAIEFSDGTTSGLIMPMNLKD
jgi:hypothetical protein